MQTSTRLSGVLLCALVLAQLGHLSCSRDGCGRSSGELAKRRIGVTTIIEQPALVDAREGFLAELRAAGIDADAVDYQNAQGSVSRASQIAAKFVGDDVDLVYAIGTPSAVAVANATERIPVVFGAVTDPVDAKLVADWARPGKNVTGVSDLVEAEPQFKFFRAVLPSSRRVGIVYNPGEPSAGRTVKALQAQADTFGFTVVTASVARSADVRAAAASLVGQADFLYIVPDNTIGAALDVMSTVSRENRIPLLSCETGAVEKGSAIAALSMDYLTLGHMAGKMAVQVLRGADPATMPVQKIAEPAVTASLVNAKAIGVEIPADVINSAAKVLR